uniref:Uncharacterized protein n=1 Tax=uncultured bacterium A1Q1_fos_2101 TaxID=1256561 RepID=L7W054_9BACT|nr:hypothetical protein [uncultured bacterium A1Q1_fos_2101]
MALSILSSNVLTSRATGSRSHQIPATAAAGDVAIFSMFGWVADGSADGSMSLSTSGWTQLGGVQATQAITYASYIYRQWVFYRVLTSGDPGLWLNVTLGSGHGDPISGASNGTSLTIVRDAIPGVAAFAESVHPATSIGGVVQVAAPVAAVSAAPSMAIALYTSVAGSVFAANGWTQRAANSGSGISNLRHRTASKIITSTGDTSPSLVWEFGGTNDGVLLTTVVIGEPPVDYRPGWSIGTLRFGGGAGWH